MRFTSAMLRTIATGTRRTRAVAAMPHAANGTDNLKLLSGRGLCGKAGERLYEVKAYR